MPRMASYVLPLDDVELLSKIPNPYGEILLVTRTLDFPTHTAIAAYLQIPVGTAKSRLSRGKALLYRLKLLDTLRTSPVAKSG